MKRILRSLARALDSRLARASLSMRREHPALIGFMFHCLFLNKSEAENGHVYPFQRITVDDFRIFVNYFSEQGYQFVNPDDLLDGLDGLDAGGRYILITFDDGYANNLRALPIANEFGVPITIFIATNNVLKQHSYWWDVHYRERKSQDMPDDEIRVERDILKEMAPIKITLRLISWFGEDAFTPRSDTDRPMTVDELKETASNPLVTIGNHTTDHAILTVQTENDAASQIDGCQNVLENLTGVRPRSIAYPNGNCDSRIIGIARKCGLELGFTTVGCKTMLPVVDRGIMQIGRFSLNGGEETLDQCRIIRSDVQLIHRYRRARLPLWRRI